MKKLLIAMAALMTLAFVGCEKEAEPAADALAGTTWESSYGGTPLTVSFNAGGVVTLNMGSETYTGTYTYKAPDVTIQMPIDGRNETFTGTCSNGVLNISSSEYGSFVFTQTGGPSPDESDDDEPQGPAADVKLVKQVINTTTHNDGETSTIIYKAEYDEHNRIVKVTEEEDDDYSDIALFSYSGNEITSRYRGATCILTLNDDGYITKGICKEKEDLDVTYYYDNDGRIIKGVVCEGSSYEDLCVITHTYDWSNGNLVREYIEEQIGGQIEDKYEIKLTYDESKTLVPVNSNFATVVTTLEFCYAKPFGGTMMLDIWGKQCKSPLKQVIDGSYVENYSYEYYEDGTVSKITITGNYDGRITYSDSYEFIYF